MRSWIQRPIAATLAAAAIAITGAAVADQIAGGGTPPPITTVPPPPPPGGGTGTVPVPASAPGCDFNATTANLTAQLTAAQPGNSVCLAAGNYGAFEGVPKSPPGVTIKPQSGAAVRMSLNMRSTASPAQGLIIDGVTFTGGVLSGPTNHVTIKNSTFTNEINIFTGEAPAHNNACGDCPAMNNNAVLFDSDTFNMADDPNGSGIVYEGRVSFPLMGSTPAGLTIQNSRFTDNCADGIFFANSGRGVSVINNEFTNLQQNPAGRAGCGPHVDPIQFDGGSSVTIRGNYFHNNSTGIASYDGGTSNDVITDNVITNTTQDSILVTGDQNSIVQHNTVIGDQVIIGADHLGNPSTNVTATNNVVPQGVDLRTAEGATGTVDYNLCLSTCVGAHSQVGAPLFQGGSTPTTWEGYRLTALSPGHFMASDGLDMGIR